MAATCTKCETPLDDNGYCGDETCPYSSWPQRVALADMYEMTTEAVAVKYGVAKREIVVAETEKTCAVCGAIVLGYQDGIDCPECEQWFCDNCYDTGKGDGCDCHPPCTDGGAA